MDGNQQHPSRYTILNQDKQFRWVLPQDVKIHVKLRFNQYV